jgi:hypothetical protein
MATSTCVKCDGSTFEMVEQKHIRGTAWKWMFIQCTGCGGVVGVVDYFNVGAALQKIAAKLGVNL